MKDFKEYKPETVGIEPFDTIRKEGRLLIEYVRGSTCYELNTPESDIDSGGVYIAKPEEILGMLNYMPQVSDERHDNTWYEIGNFIELLTKSNPTVMEALFVPDNKIIGEIHPLIKELRDHRKEFLSKDIYMPFYGYAKSQVIKARGLNKKIVNPVYERLSAFDFVYTFHNQGSTKIKNWLDNRGLKQKYCGLVNVPNMHDAYGMYYDFGNHAHNEEGWENDKAFLRYVLTLMDPNLSLKDAEIAESIDYALAIEWVKKHKFIGYRGIIDEFNDTTQLRLSSIDDKNDKPICHIFYNESGFKKHCKDYKDYKDWEAHRNETRYKSNLTKNYDSKNIMHCFRLIHMCKEILRDGEFNLVRTYDHDFLMDIRNHKYEYDYLINKLEKETEEMKQVYEESTLPEHIDREKLNNILINIRKKYLNIN